MKYKQYKHRFQLSIVKDALPLSPTAGMTSDIRGLVVLLLAVAGNRKWSWNEANGLRDKQGAVDTASKVESNNKAW